MLSSTIFQFEKKALFEKKIIFILNFYSFHEKKEESHNIIQHKYTQQQI